MVKTAFNQSKFLQTTEIKEMIGKRGWNSIKERILDTGIKLKHPFSLRSKSNRFATSVQNKPSWSCWIYIHASYNRKRFIILDFVSIAKILLKMKNIVYLIVLCINMSEKSIQNYLILISSLVYLIHIALYLQNKPVNILETVLMFVISFQQFDSL